MRYSLALLRRTYEQGSFLRALLPPELLPEEVHGNTMGYVYRRRTKPCYVCGTPIKMVRQESVAHDLVLPGLPARIRRVMALTPGPLGG